MLEIDIEHQIGAFRLALSEALPLSGCTAIFGPSGSGKSTLLRLLAGFEQPHRGRITLGQTAWCDTERAQFTKPEHRGVGYVFQEGRLFPHMTVAQNLAFAQRRAPASAISQGDVISAFDIAPFLDRAPATLSGGQKQRVALARSVLSAPSLLLLDEPLSALDRAAKAQIIPYIESLSVRFNLPVLYVSHDVDEVARLCPNTLLLADGKAQALGPTETILTQYSAAHIGDDGAPLLAIVNAGVVANDEVRGITRLSLGEAIINVPLPPVPAKIGTRCNIRIDARDVAIATSYPHDISIRNVVSAIVEEITTSGSSAICTIRLAVGPHTLFAQVTQDAVTDLALAPGMDVFALIKAVRFDL